MCTVYKPPDTSTLCFDTDLSETLVKALSLNKPIFILGDLNCNMLNDNDPACQALTSFCSSFNLLQLITHPTRITQNSETLIDVLLASNGNLVMETKVVLTNFILAMWIHILLANFILAMWIHILLAKRLGAIAKLLQ